MVLGRLAQFRQLLPGNESEKVPGEEASRQPVHDEVVEHHAQLDLPRGRVEHDEAESLRGQIEGFEDFVLDGIFQLPL